MTDESLSSYSPPTLRPVWGDPARQLLRSQRDRAERHLNGVRAVVLLLLGLAAMFYAPELTPALNRVNVLVLVPTLSWTLLQYLLFYREQTLPAWLSLVNPLVDITAVTVIIGGYATAQSATLALKTPIFLVYFVIFAARPIASSATKTALVASLAVIEYASLLALLIGVAGMELIRSPVAASGAPAISILDEGSKLLLLAVGGAIATYATQWQERLATMYHRESRDREQLEVQLAQAQVQSLKLQLHPHFLFNALNTITALIGQDPGAAERMVSGLSDLLRLSLRHASEQEVPLERELEILQHYLEIQQIRFADRLTVRYDIDDAARQAMVPNLLLQPLVENAIRHGIAPRAAPGTILVSARVAGDMVRLTVEDDGVGPGPSSGGEGIGLRNTRARLERLYGIRHRLELRGGVEGGFIVKIDIPFRSLAERPAESVA